MPDEAPVNDDLQRRIRFEELLSECSSRIARAPDARLDEVIEGVLADLGEFLGGDLAGVLRFDEADGSSMITHTWLRPGATHDPDFTRLPMDQQAPWYHARIAEGDVVVVTDVRALPAEAAVERERFERRGLRGLLVVPLVIGERLAGAIGIEAQRSAPRWSAEWITRLRLVGELIGTALARRRAELEAIRHREVLAHADRVSAVGEMVGAVVHQLDQPLTAILANARAGTRLLAADDPDLAEVRDALDDLAAGGERASAIVERLRRFLKRRSLERAPVDVSSLVAEVLELVAQDARLHGIVIEADLAADLPPVAADAVALQQVVINLLRNAADAMGGLPEARRRIDVRTGRDGDRIAVSVVDGGAGIPPEVAQQAFEPFVSTKDDGMGLGLSVCRSIVEAHGGSIEIVPQGAGGTEFRFTLPTS
ncbi:MAG: sensor histidine kinase [Planctomycetota bacterium]|jgi:signal transduction histidine kinase